MLIRLDHVREEPFRWQETVSLDAASLGRPEVVGLSGIDWGGEVAHVDPDFHLRARYRYEQTLTCSRCLQPFVQPVQGEVDSLVEVAKPSRESGEHQLAEADLDVIVVPAEKLDTEPILVEQVQLNVPMMPLCRVDCHGLCPTCGADLNAGDCGHRPETKDPRWAALAELRERLPRE